jgi:hypothetical protein
MSYIIGDGFDGYAAFNDAKSGNKWTSGNALNSISKTTRFAVGRSFNFAGNFGGHLDYHGSIAHSTWYGHIAYFDPDAFSGTTLKGFCTLYDGDPNAGGTAQCTIAWRSDGAIQFLRGTTGGTVLATFTGAYVPNSFDSWQFKAVIDASAGSIELRKNGAGSATFSAGGLNTKGSTASTADSVQIGNASGVNQCFDDVFFCVGDGTYPNTWTGDVRAIQLQGLTDTAQKQFAQNSSGSLDFSLPAGTNTIASNANTIYCFGAGPLGFSQIGCIPTQGGTLGSATVTFNAGFTGNCKLAVYLLDGDTPGFNADRYPGTLVGVSTQVTNPSATQAFTFSPAIGIKAGFAYGYALLADANFVMKGAYSGNNGQGYIYTSVNGTAVTYAGGFPDLKGIVSGSNTGNYFATITATLTATNAGCVNNEVEDGATTYLSDGTVNDFDLYNLETLNYTPAGILGVMLRTFVAKSDAGGRGIKIAGKSGATSFATPEYFPLTAYSEYDVFYGNDPNTSAAWSVSAVNALQVGPELSS